MTDAVQVAFITSIPPTFAVLVVAYKAFRGQKKTHENLKQLGEKVNGRLEELLQSRVAEAYERGFKEGQNSQRTRRNDK